MSAPAGSHGTDFVPWAFADQDPRTHGMQGMPWLPAQFDPDPPNDSSRKESAPHTLCVFLGSADLAITF
ncbi:MAG TPA: hypothetical protein VMV34_00080 [Terriglobia bacterium]|nr:hypothetical protein [Terriglobia bacterium]